MSAAHYRISAQGMAPFRRRLPADADAAFDYWADLTDAVGPALLPFVVRCERYAAIPFAELGVKPVPLADMTPHPGEMWVLFCFRHAADELADSPLRDDGFVLVLEWRPHRPDSALLSSAFRRLADQVRRQLDCKDDWGLHPAFARYGDRVDFTDVELFADADHVEAVASAWGALAAGLHTVLTGRMPTQWPFPTIQWDADAGCGLGVAGLAKKLSVAADCGASVVTVARTQAQEASRILRALRKGPGGARFAHLRVYAVRDVRTPAKLAEEIAWGDVRQRRLIRRVALALSVPLALLLAGLALFLWDTHRPVTKYYAAIAYHYGLPEGLYEVSPDAVAQRGQTFRFDYRGVHWNRTVHDRWQRKGLFGFARRLVRVVNVNARNVPCEVWSEGYNALGDVPRIQEFEYDAAGRLCLTTSRLRGGGDLASGKKVRLYHYETARGVTNGLLTVSNGDGSACTYMPPSASQVITDFDDTSEGGGRIYQFLLERDADGRMTRKTYAERLEPTADGDGVGGVAYAYNRDGMVRQTRFLDLGGEGKCANRWGVARTEYEWDGSCLSSVETWDEHGNRVCDRLGVMRYKFSHDEHGNNTGFLFLDAEGRPTDNVPSREWPYRFRGARIVRENGLEVLWENLLPEETNQVQGVNVAFFAKRRSVYDDMGDCVEERFYDAKGGPWRTNGWCVSRQTFDRATGEITSARTFAADGLTPMPDEEDDSFGRENQYDAAGNCIESRFLGADGGLMTNRFGHAIQRNAFDAKGRIVLQTYYDASTNALPGKGALRISYDKLGRNRCWQYYTDGNCRVPAANAQGLSRTEFQYDEAGHLATDVSFAVPGTGESLRIGRLSPCAKSVGSYDQYGNLVSAKYYDANGRLIAPVAGQRWAYTVSKYDVRGRRLSMSWFDANEQPVSACPGGSLRVELSYFGTSRRIRQIERFGWERDEKGLDDVPGARRCVKRYDEAHQDKPSEVLYFDAQGRCIKSGKGDGPEK